jgi:indolepyruvate ferredoxin oxidoreductase beta subunit
MAQRGGIVESAVVMGDVHSPIVSDGEADILIGFEPMETLRALGKARKGGMVLTNTAPLPPFTVSIGQGKYPDVQELMQLIQSKPVQVLSLDAKDLAQKAGNVQSLNMVLLGGLIGMDQLPISPEDMKDTLKTQTKKAFLESNLQAFDQGWERVQSMLQ